MVSLIKNKFLSREQILGKYYGYYLHKDTPKSAAILRESEWKISSDFRRDNFIVTTYRMKDIKNGKQKKVISYTGKMWKQENHYLLQLDSLGYTETIFERKLKITKAEGQYPIIGISLAVVTQGNKIRANISMLSREKLSLDDFNKIVSENKVVFERDTYNLRIER